MQSTICDKYVSTALTGGMLGPVINVPVNESWIITAVHFQNSSNMNLRPVQILVNEKVVSEYVPSSRDPLLVLGIPVAGGSVIKFKLPSWGGTNSGTFKCGISVDRKILG